MPEGEEIKKKINRDLNPEAAGPGLSHNHGQPQRAPYANTGKFETSCSAEHANSLQCIERNYENRPACEPFFSAYKACRKEENDKRKEANANKPWF
jgi:hypothetical protein